MGRFPERSSIGSLGWRQFYFGLAYLVSCVAVDATRVHVEGGTILVVDGASLPCLG